MGSGAFLLGWIDLLPLILVAEAGLFLALAFVVRRARRQPGAPR